MTTQRKASPARATSAKTSATKMRPKKATSTEPSASKAVAPEPTPDDGLDLAKEALALALDKKGLEPVLLDVRSLCSYCNYQLVISGRSERQVEAISDGIKMGLRDRGLRVYGSEGARSGQWSLLDYGDFIVHVFFHAVREHYDLEGLWNDAPRVAIDVPPDARIAADDAY